MSDNMFSLDLDAARKVRAAEREGKKRDAPIILGGDTIAVLPVELPVDVLAPLRDLDGDITLIIREALSSVTEGRNAKQTQIDTTALVIDLLASNPDLPVTFLDTVQKVARNLLTDEGMDRLVAQRPTVPDYTELIKGVFSFYGVTLGEASPSSGSSTDEARTDEPVSETSSGTSSATSESTPDESGTTPEPTPSLESAVS